MDDLNLQNQINPNLERQDNVSDGHFQLLQLLGGVIILIGLATFLQYKFAFFSKLPFFSQKLDKDVLAAYDIVPYTQLRSNLKYVFNNSADVLNGMKIRGDVDADGSNVNLGNGTILASNIIYRILAGDGITITGGQNPTISLTSTPSSGVSSIENITGDVDLVAGSNISLTTDGNKITINASGSITDTNTTYSAGEGLALDNTTFSVDFNGIGLQDTANSASGASVIGVYTGGFSNITTTTPGADLQTVLEAIDSELSTIGGGGITAVGNIAAGNAFTSGAPGSNLFIADTGWIGLGSGSGRIVWRDQSTDTISFLDAFVGIGTSNPQYTLDVAGNIRAGTDIYLGNIALGQTGGASVLGANSGSITYSSASNVQQILEDLDSAINNFGTGGSGPWLIAGNYAYLNPALASYLGNPASGGTNKLSNLYFADNSILDFGTDNDFKLLFDGTNLTLGSSASTYLSIGNSGTTGNFKFNNGQFYIRGDGNLGIGTTSPGYALDINGGLRVGGTAVFSSVSNVSDNNSVLTVNGGVLSSINTGGWDKTTSDDLTTSIIFLGDVSGPYNNLQINPNTITDVELASSGVSPGTYGTTSGTGAYIPRLTVDTDGRITSASTVAFALNFENPLTFGNGLTRSGNNINLGGSLNSNTRFFTSGTEVLFMNTNGRVGIGTTAPSYKLDVFGTVRAWDVITQDISLASLSTSLINAQFGFNGYTNFTGGIGTGGNGKDNITSAQRLTSAGNLTNIGNYQGGEMLLTNGGTFASKTDYVTASAPSSVAMGDMNGDGKLDLAVANSSSTSVSVFMNSGTGNFLAKVDYTTGSSPIALAMGDLSGDGRPDIAVANATSNTVSVFISSGTGNLAAKVDYTTATDPQGVAIADFNSDGKGDIVTSNLLSASVSVLMNKGDGTFNSKFDYSVGSAPQDVTAGDVDGDGKIDIIAANWSSNSVSVLLNNGNGTFASAVDYTTTSNPESVVVADLNADGKLDIAAAGDGGAVSILINNGDGTFASKVDYTAGTVPRDIAVGDINGDGKPDLAVVNRDSTNVSVFMNNGNGTFASAVNYTTGTTPFSLAIGDVNGDGKADMAVAASGSDRINIYLNNINTIFYAQASTGRVGIGTTAPQYTLDVAGNIRAGTDVYIGSVGLGSTAGASLIGVNSAGFGVSTSPTVQGQLSALNSAVSSISNPWTDGGNFLFPTNRESIGNLAVGATGKISGLSLGNTAPLAIGASNNFVLLFNGINLNLGDSTNTFLSIGDSGTAGNFAFNTDDLYVRGDGNVGIGNTSPQSQLHVRGTPGATDVAVTIENGSNNNGSDAVLGLRTAAVTSNEVELRAVRSNNMGLISTYGNDNFAIISAAGGGNVGIATTAPANKLSVAGGASIGSTYAKSGTAPANGLVVQGNVGIGTTTLTANMALDVAGNIRAGTDVYIGSIQLGATAGATKVGFNPAGLTYIQTGDTTVQTAISRLDTQLASVAGGATLWTDGGNYLYPTSGEYLGIATTAASGKIHGLFLSDTAPVVFGTDNDFRMIFNGTASLFIGDSANNFLSIGDSGTTASFAFNTDDLFVNGNNRVGINTVSPLATLDVRGDIFTDRYANSSTNTLVGLSAAGGTNLSGQFNSLFGSLSFHNITSGASNEGLGYQSGYSNTSGSNNVAIGVQALYYNQTGSNNVAIGSIAGNGTSGQSFANNTLVGFGTGYSLRTSANNNTLIGYGAGDQITSGTGNIVIGYQIDAMSATGNNQLNIGNLIKGYLGVGATINGNATLGSSSSSTHRILGTVTAADLYTTTVGVTNRDLYVDNTGVIGYVSSSIRYKENVNNLDNIDWLYNLRPVNYEYKSDATNTPQYGLIAEEVDKVNQLLVSYDSNGLPETVNYSKLITPLLKAVQTQRSDLNSIITDSQSTFETQDTQILGIQDDVTSYKKQVDSMQSQINELFDIVHNSDKVATQEADVKNLTDRVSFLEEMMFGKQASEEATLTNSIGSTENYPDGDVLGLSDQKIVVQDLTVTGKTNLYDLGVVGDMSVGQLVVRGNESAINSLALPLQIQSEATAEIQLMAGKVVIDTSGNLTVQKEITAKKYNVDTTDENAASIGKGTIKIGETEVIIKSSSVTSKSNIFLTPTIETDQPLAVVEKIDGKSFKVKIVKEAEEDIGFNWWIVN